MKKEQLGARYAGRCQRQLYRAQQSRSGQQSSDKAAADVEAVKGAPARLSLYSGHTRLPNDTK